MESTAYAAIALALTAAAVGCGGRSMPPLPDHHPASPKAAEAPLPPAAQTLSVDGAGGNVATGEKVVTVYRYAMQVAQSGPGDCPKCGMRLVPQDQQPYRSGAQRRPGGSNHGHGSADSHAEHGGQP